MYIIDQTKVHILFSSDLKKYCAYPEFYLLNMSIRSLIYSVKSMSIFSSGWTRSL